MRTGELKDGQFIGLGDGFDEARGGVKTVVNIKNNVIESIVFVEGQGYSGLDYMGISSRVIPHLCGEAGKRNIAILKLYRKYIDQIAGAKDHAKEAEKLTRQRVCEQDYRCEKSRCWFRQLSDSIWVNITNVRR